MGVLKREPPPGFPCGFPSQGAHYRETLSSIWEHAILRVPHGPRRAVALLARDHPSFPASESLRHAHSKPRSRGGSDRGSRGYLSSPGGSERSALRGTFLAGAQQGMSWNELFWDSLRGSQQLDCL